MEHKIKIAYIGGGSKLWARVLMNDLALADGLSGEIALYDIDYEAAERNRIIGEKICADERAVSMWHYTNHACLKTALEGADFVVISILPGTFDEMQCDVHTPEKYGIYQSVGDTAGPGGVLRAMRTLPIYYEFARAIREICPNAWVINFTNPMSACVKALYDEFPQIKAFGCCHEVFHAQDFLCLVAEKELGINRPERSEIYTDVCGVNHFTWITRATYQNIDLLSLLPSFMDKYFEDGYASARGKGRFAFREGDYFIGANRVKMDMLRRFGALGAAGDRHLAEFMDTGDYLASPDSVRKWGFSLTPVSWRVQNQREKIDEAIAQANGTLAINVAKSDEEAVDLIKALCGFGNIVSNVNMPNLGQSKVLPHGAIVESNCLFSADSLSPIISADPPEGALRFIKRASNNIDLLCLGIREKNMNMIFDAFCAQGLCCNLSHDDALSLFREMIDGTREYLVDYFGDSLVF